LPNDKTQEVKAVIYDNTGNVVFETSGRGKLSWNLTNNAGRNVANGTYLIVAEAERRERKLRLFCESRREEVEFNFTDILKKAVEKIQPPFLFTLSRQVLRFCPRRYREFVFPYFQPIFPICHKRLCG